MSVQILHADALWMRSLGVDADAMIVDPPYAARVHTKAVSARTGGAGVRSRDLGFDSLSSALMARIALYASQVRRWSLVYCDAESTHLWREAMALAGVEYVRAVPWVRWTQPQMSGDRPPSGREEVLWFHRGGGRKVPRGPRPDSHSPDWLTWLESTVRPVKKAWNGPGSLTHLEHKALRATRGAAADKHPTEKPLDQLLDLVSWVTDPGETVIDPCGGGGTTALACALLGRGAVVLEQDATWASAAFERCYRARSGYGGTEAWLCDRDAERVRRYVERTCEEATRVPFPRKPCEQKTWERAQRRLADVPRVVAALEDPKP